VGTQGGTAPQNVVNTVVPSVGAGINVANDMLMMIRDDSIKTQQIWSLHEYDNPFNNSNVPGETSPVYGVVVDMGGETNLKRPVYYAEQMANTAILPTMLATTLSGANPTWNQPQSVNGSLPVVLPVAHELQTYAFTDGGHNRSLVVFNLSRTSALPVTFSDVNAPSGTVTVTQLTSANPTDNNESSAVVSPTTTTLTNFPPATPYNLPPFSMTVFTWQQ